MVWYHKKRKAFEKASKALRKSAAELKGIEYGDGSISDAVRVLAEAEAAINECRSVIREVR